MSSRRSTGFSLLELMVAVAIMATGLALLYRGMGGSLQSAGQASRYTRAVVLAESLLQQRETVPAAGCRESGRSAELRWAVSSTLYDRAASAIPLHRVEVDVRWTDGARERLFTLVTLRPQQVMSSGEVRP